MEDTPIALFYNKFRHQPEHSTANVIGAILKQLVVRGAVLEGVQKEFRKAKSKSVVEVWDFRISSRC